MTLEKGNRNFRPLLPSVASHREPHAEPAQYPHSHTASTEASGSFRRDAATRCYSSDSFSSHRARDSSVCQSPGGFWVLFSCCYEKVGGASCGWFSSAKAVIVTLCCSGVRHDAVAFISCQSSTHLVVRQA